MSKLLFRLGAVAMFGFATMGYAQQENTTPDYSGKVGINTDTPTETLDINGSARVRSLKDADKNYIYDVVANENGTLGKVKTSKNRWNLYEADFNTRQNVQEEMDKEKRTTENETNPEETWEIPDSDVIFTVPDEDNTNTLTKLHWNTWFEIIPRDLGEGVMSYTTDRGSFRFFIKYQEIDTNNSPIGEVQYTNTVYMTSFSNINSDTSGEFYRIGMSPSYVEKNTDNINRIFFERGKTYKASLVVGLESMRGEENPLTVKNWGVDASAETYYQYK